MEKRNKIETIGEEKMVKRIRRGRQSWRIVGIYVNMEDILQSIDQ